MNYMETNAIHSAIVKKGKITNISEVALVSIAISMKRVADEVQGIPFDAAPGADNSKHRMGLTDAIMHAIEQGIIAARNS